MAQTGRSQRGIIIIAAVAAVLLAVGATAAALFLLPVRSVSGQVVDSTTGGPLAGASLKVNDLEITASDDGVFTVDGIRFGTVILAEAPGYHSGSIRVGNDGQITLPLNPRILEGAVTDETTGEPLQGVQVKAGELATQTDSDGKFTISPIALGTDVAFAAEGFHASTQKYEDQPSIDVALQPTSLTVKAVNQYTGDPLQGAEVADSRTTSQTDAQGDAVLRYLRDGDEIDVRLEGFTPAKVTYSGQESAEATLRPDTLAGTVKDEEGKPLAGATVTLGTSNVTTDQQGSFKFTGVPEKADLTAVAEGYQRAQMVVERQTTVEITLEKPFAAKGLYLTYYGVGDEGLRGHVLDVADTTEVNAVVIDIKGDRGWIAYKSSVPMVAEIGAQQDITMPDPKALLADLKSRGIYTIARIVTFKDNPLATARPDLAVTNGYTGQPWVDMEGLRWIDAMQEEAWDYNIALAVEAIELGFDEVQFDYIRFPTDAGAGNPLDAVRFAKENTMENRTAAINGFLEKASQAIHAAGGKVSVDIFGYVVWRDDDMGIGQHLEDMAQRVDYVSPMVYPNLFWDGIALDGEVRYADQQAGLYPYEIVYESMKVAAERIGPDKLRPWLQYYNDYITGKSYGPAEMEAQKRATYDNGITGWLFWDPTNAFSKGGFNPE